MTKRRSPRLSLYKKSRPVMVLDCSALCHYVRHALSGLQYAGEGTGVIYGFLGQLFRLQKTLRCSNWVFCWDSPESDRLKLFPAYKKSRKEKTEEEQEQDRLFYGEMEVLKNSVIPSIGFSNSFEQRGKEADDIIAAVCSDTRHHFIIVSGDQDLYQLLRPDVEMFKYANRTRYTFRDFRREWGISSTKWRQVKALAGCSSDGVPGIPGVGNGTAVKYLTGKLNPNSKIYKKITDPNTRAIIQLTSKLTKLPMEGTELFKLTPTHLRWKDFEEQCLSYGMDSFLEDDMKRQWSDLFKMVP